MGWRLFLPFCLPYDIDAILNIPTLLLLFLRTLNNQKLYEWSQAPGNESKISKNFIHVCVCLCSVDYLLRSFFFFLPFLIFLFIFYFYFYSVSLSAAFIRVVGSEFVQKYLGEGPRMVRDVFRLARENAPSIIFIDEIDAIATKRFDAQTGGMSSCTQS